MHEREKQREKWRGEREKWRERESARSRGGTWGGRERKKDEKRECV